MIFGKFEEGKVYTLVKDYPAWKSSELNPEEIKEWKKFSYVKNRMVVFKTGTQFEKLEDEFVGEVAFKVIDEEHYELAFDYKDIDAIHKAFGLEA